MRIFFFTIALVAVITSCSTTKNIAVSQTDADRGAIKFPGYSLAQLNQGRLIYEENCFSCHALHKPNSQSEEQWNVIVPKMVKKVNKKAGSEVLTSDKKELILRYLVTMSTAPKMTN